MASLQQPATLSVESIRQHFVDGVTVFISGGCGQPNAVLDVLAEAELSTVFRVIDCSVPGLTATDLDRVSSKAVLNTGFFLGSYRPLHQQGRLEYVPAYHSARYRAMDDDYNINIALIKVSEPNAQGQCSASLHADYSQEMLSRADVLIAEINPNMPYISDALQIPLADIDYSVAASSSLLEYSVAAGGELDLVIAEHIAALVNDGDCLQLGIGALPVSILQTLGDKKDLGVHTGLLTEAFVPLVESGVVNGSKKGVDRGKVTTGIVAGSREFYQWCASYPDLRMRSVTYTHNAGVLAQLDNLVAINTTLEIDLFGQINSETIKGKQIGGGGGLVDFLRGARSSKGGRSIIALQSTAKGGTISKIAPLLSIAPVTAIRNDVDYVVTEHGVARLSNLSVEKRAEALIAIAHPTFRAELTAQWQQLMSAF
ncbi:MAG: acetyl-CoA hydrolase/transferase family protein [Gammaproteobacteria bacterium]|nr:acetyl-CoA hydrolase/transferase family protein [Gammaproteobacteria bacterium]MBQ0840759.1 acetyl-CoA hydrolase/transferase family protein [Gammaproteobacteria bacterium]